MLGRQAGDFMECEVSGRNHRFQIEGVFYQPEAANDDDW